MAMWNFKHCAGGSSGSDEIYEYLSFVVVVVDVVSIIILNY